MRAVVERRRDEELGAVVEVLRLVIVELSLRDDFAGHRGLGRVVAKDGDFDFPRLCDRLLDDHFAVVLEREIDVKAIS